MATTKSWGWTLLLSALLAAHGTGFAQTRSQAAQVVRFAVVTEGEQVGTSQEESMRYKLTAMLNNSSPASSNAAVEIVPVNQQNPTPTSVGAVPLTIANAARPEDFQSRIAAAQASSTPASAPPRLILTVTN